MYAHATLKESRCWLMPTILSTWPPPEFCCSFPSEGSLFSHLCSQLGNPFAFGFRCRGSFSWQYERYICDQSCEISQIWIVQRMCLSRIELNLSITRITKSYNGQGSAMCSAVQTCCCYYEVDILVLQNTWTSRPTLPLLLDFLISLWYIGCL